MNSQQDIGKFLMSLSEAFPGQVKPTTLDLYLRVLEPKLKDKKLESLLVHFMENNKFFPTCSEIVAFVEPAQESSRAKATLCVDRFIMYLTGNLKRDEITDHDYSYCKKRFNCDKHSAQMGGVDLNFKRREWIDICELDFETYERTGELPFMLGARQSNPTLINFADRITRPKPGESHD